MSENRKLTPEEVAALVEADSGKPVPVTEDATPQDSSGAEAPMPERFDSPPKRFLSIEIVIVL